MQAEDGSHATKNRIRPKRGRKTLNLRVKRD